MEINEKIIFKSRTGSYLYGTNSETSDIDIKGIFLPNKEDLLLVKAPKHYVFNTSNGQKNTKDDIDETYYSLHYFFELLISGETNALDLFFAYTNKDAVIYKDSIWDEIVNNADKLITNNINKYLGFCRAQAIKYSIKGDKLDAYIKLKDFINDLVNKNIKDETGAWITLGTALKLYLTFNGSIYSDYEKKGKHLGKRAKILNNMFGDHAYIVLMNNKETYLMISDILFNFNDSIIEILHKVNRTIAQYGKRAENAKNANGADYKALSHAVRVLFQAEDLLINGKIIFPLSKERTDFIKSIKYNKTNMTYNEIVNYIDNGIKRINEEIFPKSKFQNKVNQNWINTFILNLYK